MVEELQVGWYKQSFFEEKKLCACEGMRAAHVGWDDGVGRSICRCPAPPGKPPCLKFFFALLAGCALQAFAEAQKLDLAAVRAELEDSQRSGREKQHRLRGLEEQLLAAQDACSKANSQVWRRRGCASNPWAAAVVQSVRDASSKGHLCWRGWQTWGPGPVEAVLWNEGVYRKANKAWLLGFGLFAGRCAQVPPRPSLPTP